MPGLQAPPHLQEHPPGVHHEGPPPRGGGGRRGLAQGQGRREGELALVMTEGAEGLQNVMARARVGE